MKKNVLSGTLACIYSFLGLSIAYRSNTYLFLLVGCLLGLLFCYLYLQSHQETFPIDASFLKKFLEKENNKKKKLHSSVIIKEETLQRHELFIPFIFSSHEKHSHAKKFFFPKWKLLLVASVFFVIAIVDTTNSFFTLFLGWQSLLFWGQTWLYWKSGM